MIEIERYKPCAEAMEYRKQFVTFQEAWESCPRGDWMLWIAFKVEVDKRTLFLAKGLCAATVRHLMQDQKSKDAVLTVIRYGRGKATEEELTAATKVARATYYAVNTATIYAAYTTTFTSVAATAAYAAYAATAADTAAAATARISNQKKTADICRKILTKEVFKLLNLT